jgi:hypothetical protein
MSVHSRMELSIQFHGQTTIAIISPTRCDYPLATLVALSLPGSVVRVTTILEMNDMNTQTIYKRCPAALAIPQHHYVHYERNGSVYISSPEDQLPDEITFAAAFPSDSNMSFAFWLGRFSEEFPEAIFSIEGDK